MAHVLRAPMCHLESVCPLVPGSTKVAVTRHTQRAVHITQHFEQAVSQLARAAKSQLQYKLQVLKLQTEYMAQLKAAASELAHNFEYLRRAAH